MSILAKRALLAALTGIGLVLLAVGLWFTLHLGSSGSASFRAEPESGVVVLEPSLLNRVDDPVTVTARIRGGGDVWVGRTTPSDAGAVLGDASRVTLTGVKVRSWALVQSREGSGAAGPDLAAADVWRQVVTGKGTASLEVDQGDAPEALVLTTPNGGEITSVTVTIERRTWIFQSLLVALVGLLAAVAGGVGLAASFRRPRSSSEGTPSGDTSSDDASDDPHPPSDAASDHSTSDGADSDSDADDRPATEVSA